MNWKKMTLSMIGVLTVFAIVSPASIEALELIPFFTPPAGGGAYIMGAGIVTVTNKYLPDVKLVHEATSSSLEIIRRMMQREAANKDAFGIFSCDEGLQDGSLDGGFLAGGYPIASYSELSSRQSVRIVPVDEKILKKIITEHTYYYATVVKAGSYKGLEQDTPILGWGTAIWTHARVSEDLVYRFLKNLFDHRQEYYQIHTAAKDMQPEVVTKGIAVPFHPGAEKYLREMGWFKK